MNYKDFEFKDITFTIDSIDQTVHYIHSKGTVVCIYLDKDDNLLLSKQYRPIFGKEFLELPGGSREKGETLEQAAIREFEEETGLKVISIENLTSMIPSIGSTDEVIHIYKVNIDKYYKTRGENKITLIRYHLSRAVELVLNGEIRDGKTMLAILYVAWMKDKNTAANKRQ